MAAQLNTGSSDFVDVILHRQLAIQSDSEVAYGVDTLNDIMHDCQG